MSKQSKCDNSLEQMKASTRCRGANKENMSFLKKEMKEYKQTECLRNSSYYLRN